MRQPELLNERQGDFYLSVETVPEEYDWSWYEPAPPDSMSEPYTELPAPALADAGKVSVTEEPVPFSDAASSEHAPTSAPAVAGLAATFEPVPPEDPASESDAPQGEPAFDEASAASVPATTPAASASSTEEPANPEPDLKQLFG